VLRFLRDAEVAQNDSEGDPARRWDEGLSACAPATGLPGLGAGSQPGLPPERWRWGGAGLGGRRTIRFLASRRGRVGLLRNVRALVWVSHTVKFDFSENPRIQPVCG
jgi:hypothetical protein